ncbi:MAG TPA: helix-turn-helix transcriptional regulator [Chloroflexota bacterium]
MFPASGRASATAYAAALCRARTRRGVSQRTLARGLGVSHTLVVRSEAGVRPPADVGEVLRVVDLLGLDPEETDELLTAAGYWPAVFLGLGHGDPTLRALADALTRAAVDPVLLERLRRAIGGVLELVPPARAR